MGHDFALYDSQLKFLTRRGKANKAHPYDEEFLTVLIKWLNEHS